jgi:hypothetical protein
MSNDDRKSSLPNLFTILVFGLLFAEYLTACSDLDYTWHVRTGRQIAAAGKLRVPDEFSYTIAGTPVPDFEWLYELVLWEVWSHVGQPGLQFLKILCSIAPLWALDFRLRRAGAGWPVRAAAIMVAAFVVSGAWNLRPLACTTVALLLLAGFLHEQCTEQKPLPVWLPVLMVAWANVHPGIIMGQALLVGCIGWETLNYWLKINPPLSSWALRRLALVGSLSAAATFLSPDPLERLAYPFLPTLRDPVMRGFTEMCSPWALWPRFPVRISVAAASLILAGWTICKNWRSYRVWELAYLLTLAFLAANAIRSLADCLLNALAFSAPRWSARLVNKIEILLGAPWLRVQKGWLLAGLAALLLLSCCPPVTNRLPWREMPDWPAKGATWIEQQGLGGNFFASPNYGAYLGWRLDGRARTYVDTRGFFFPPDLIRDSYLVPEMAADWRERLRKIEASGTDYFFLEVSGPRGKLWEYIEDHVSDPLYLDDQCVLLTTQQVHDAVSR